MNSIQSFGNNVVEGAKMLSPSSIGRGIKSLFSNKKKNIAQKMTTPSLTTSPNVAPVVSSQPLASTQYNQGFKAYKNSLDNAMNGNY